MATVTDMATGAEEPTVTSEGRLPSAEPCPTAGAEQPTVTTEGKLSAAEPCRRAGKVSRLER